MRELTDRENQISHEIVGAAIHVHTVLGPGLLEKVYEECLSHVLTQKKLLVERQKSQPIFFEGLKLDGGLKLDLIVEDTIIVELKTAEKILPVHEAQLHTYLKLSGKPLGLLFNFNVHRLKDGGIKRLVMTNSSLRS